MSENSTRDINKQIIKGSAWTISFRVIEKFVSIISTIILARLLVPEDFGIVAIAMMVVALMELMRAFGFESALIQNQSANDDHYNTVWTFNIVAALVIAIAVYLSAPLFANFFEEPALTNVLRVLAISVLLSGFENVGIINFRKDLKFNKDFNYMVVKRLISFSVTISLAVILRNYWALIIGTVITKFLVVSYSYIIHPYKPKLSLRKTRELSSFSFWLFINNLLLFAIHKVPQAIIGKLGGSSQLGLFSLSRDITYATTTAIVMPINRAAFPGYSKLSHDGKALKDSLLGTLGVIALIITPAAAGISAIAPLMVPVVLGEKWLEAIPIMQILAFSGLFFALANVNAVYLALGRPFIIARISLFRLCVYLPTMVIATREYGVVGAAWSLLMTGILILPATYTPIAKILGIRIREFTALFARPAISALIMYAVTHEFLDYLPNDLQAPYKLIWLVFLIAFGAVLYVTSVIGLWFASGKPVSAEFHIFESLKQRRLFSKSP
ncbi:MAG: hypothetical protein CMK32_14200 [Porticoccaceae bacterium]|nr:hypothetical protein [Porticoccaceae bacterium]